MSVISAVLALLTLVAVGCQPVPKTAEDLPGGGSGQRIIPVHAKPAEQSNVPVHERLFLDVAKKDKKQSGISRIFGQQLTSNTTLYLRNSPFEVLYNLVIPSAFRLTIEQGVELRFRPNAGITVRGVLLAEGTKQQPILMVAEDSTTRWTGLFFDSISSTFDVRLDKSLYYDQGFLQVFDGSEWRYVCGHYWTEANSQVACRQLGFQYGETDGEVHVDRFSDMHEEFSNVSVTCLGTEAHLKHCAAGPTICSIEQCQSVIRLKCAKLRGMSPETSVLNFVNVSSSEHGIVVRGLMPKMRGIYSVDSRRNGFTFDLHYIPTAGSAQLLDCVAVKSGRDGFSAELSFPVYDKSLGFVLDKAMAIQSGAAGISVAGRGSVLVKNSTFFNNNGSGLSLRLAAGRLVVHNAVFAANSRYAVKIVHNGCHEFLEVGLHGCNVTQHWRDEAVLVDSVCQTVLYLDNNSFWENYNSVIGFGRISRCQISVTNNLFYKNKGDVVKFHQLLGRNNIIFEANRFDLNFLNTLSPAQAVLHIVYRGDAQDLSNLAVIRNSFHKNTLTNIIALNVADGTQAVSSTAGLNFQFLRNNLTENLSPVVMFVDAPTASIFGNVFANPYSDYELMSGVATSRADIQATRNYWGTADEIRAQERVYDRRMNASLTAVALLPVVRSEEQLSEIDAVGRNQTVFDFFGGSFDNGSFEVLERSQPYLIRNSINVGHDAVLTISAGNVVEFLPDVQVVVHGRLVAKGQLDKPIIFRAASTQPWAGVVFEEDAEGTVENCVMVRARLPVELKTDRVKIARNLIINFQRSAVLINGTTSLEVDLGFTLIRDSPHFGIAVSSRVMELKLRNVVFTNMSGNGVHVYGPLTKLSIENVAFLNCSSYAIFVSSTAPEMQTTVLKRVKIINHGSAVDGAIYVNANFTRSLVITDCYLSHVKGKSVELQQTCHNGSIEPSDGQQFAVTVANNTLMNSYGPLLELWVREGATVSVSNNYVAGNHLSDHSSLVAIHHCTGTSSSDLNLRNASVKIEGNFFIKNSGNYTISIMRLQRTTATFITRNMFIKNMNDGAVIFILVPAAAHVFCNYFEENQTPYAIDWALFASETGVDAVNNCWLAANDSQLIKSFNSNEYRAANAESSGNDTSSLSPFNTTCEESCASPSSWKTWKKHRRPGKDSEGELNDKLLPQPVKGEESERLTLDKSLSNADGDDGFCAASNINEDPDWLHPLTVGYSKTGKDAYTEDRWHRKPEQCRLQPEVRYLLPPALPIDDQATPYIYIVGRNLEKNNKLFCKFGQLNTTAEWISPEKVRCPVPKEVVKQEKGVTVQLVTSRSTVSKDNPNQLALVFYKPCSTRTCPKEAEMCFQGHCFSDDPRTSSACGANDLLRYLNSSLCGNEMTMAQEGVPYEGVICTAEAKGHGSRLIWQLATGPDSMVINPYSGVLSWYKPIAEDQPVRVAVVGRSTDVETVTSFELKVLPSYVPVIRSVNRTDYNSFLVDGYVKFLKVFMRRVPILLKAYVKGRLEQSSTIWSSDSGRFSAEYVYPLEQPASESLTFVVCHPALASLNSSGLANEGESYTVLLDVIRFQPDADPIRCSAVERCSVKAVLENAGYRHLHDVELKPFRGADGRRTIGMKPIRLSVLKPTAVAHVNLDFGIVSSTFIGCALRLTAREGVDLLTAVNVVVSPAKDMLVTDPPMVTLQKLGGELRPSITTVSVIWEHGDDLQPPSFKALADSTDVLFLVSTANTTDSTVLGPPFKETALTVGTRNASKIATPHSGRLALKDDVGVRHNLQYEVKPCKGSCWLVVIRVLDYSALVQKHVFIPVSKAEIQLSDASLDFGAKQLAQVEGNPFSVPRSGLYEVAVSKPGLRPLTTLLNVKTPHTEYAALLREDRSSDAFTLSRNGNGKFVLQRPELPELLQTTPTMVSIDFLSPSEQLIIVTVRNMGLLPVYDVKLRSPAFQDHLFLQIESNEIRVLPSGRAASLLVTFRFNDSADRSNARCDLYVFAMYYSLWINGTDILVNQPFVVTKKTYDQPEAIVCEDQDGTLTQYPLPLKTALPCSCDSYIETRCFDQPYQPIGICGLLLTTINRTASLESILRTADMVYTCQKGHVDLEAVQRVISCVTSIPSPCLESEELEKWRLGHRSSLPMPLIPDGVRVLFKFSELLSLIRSTLRFDSLRTPMSPWYHKFRMVIADLSAKADVVTEDELHFLLNSLVPSQRKTARDFVIRWNNTVSLWNAGVDFDAAQPGFSLDRLLRLQEVIKQISGLSSTYHERNPFAVLDRIMAEAENARYQATNLHPYNCLNAYLSITQAYLEPDVPFTVRMTLRNTRPRAISQISPELKIITMTGAEIAALANVTGRINIGENENILSQQSGSITWSVRITDQHLMEAKDDDECRVLISIRFRYDRQLGSAQVLSERLYTRPVRRVSVLYLFHPVVADKPLAGRTPNIAVVVQNNGYQDLTDVRLATRELSLRKCPSTASGESPASVAFRISRVFLDNRLVDFRTEQRVPLLRAKGRAQLMLVLKADVDSCVAEFRQQVIVNGKILPSSFLTKNLTVVRWFYTISPVPFVALLAEDETSSPTAVFLVREGQLRPVVTANLTLQVLKEDRNTNNIELTLRDEPSEVKGRLESTVIYGQLPLYFRTATQRLLLASSHNGSAEDWWFAWVSDDQGEHRASSLSHLHLLVCQMSRTPSHEYRFVFGIPKPPTSTEVKETNVLEVAVSPKTAPGTLILRLPEAALSGELPTDKKYLLPEGQGHFEMDPDTGTLILTHRLTDVDPDAVPYFCLYPVILDERTSQATTSTVLIRVVSEFPVSALAKEAACNRTQDLATAVSVPASSTSSSSVVSKEKNIVTTKSLEHLTHKSSSESTDSLNRTSQSSGTADITSTDGELTTSLSEPFSSSQSVSTVGTTSGGQLTPVLPELSTSLAKDVPFSTVSKAASKAATAKGSSHTGASSVTAPLGKQATAVTGSSASSSKWGISSKSVGTSTFAPGWLPPETTSSAVLPDIPSKIYLTEEKVTKLDDWSTTTAPLGDVRTHPSFHSSSESLTSERHEKAGSATTSTTVVSSKPNAIGADATTAISSTTGKSPGLNETAESKLSPITAVISGSIQTEKVQVDSVKHNEKLIELACKMKRVKPIWAFICDLDNIGTKPSKDGKSSGATNDG